MATSGQQPGIDPALVADFVEVAHDAIIVRDDQGAVTFWNSGAEALYGWSRSEAIGRTSKDLLGTEFPVPVEDVMEQLARGGFWQGELRQRARDGSEIVVESRWVVRGTGVERRFMEINRDITKRKEYERALSRAREEAEGANLAKTEFLSRMSHELRTPLTAILGFGQLLGRRELDDQGREFVNLIVSAGRHLLDLINEVLDLTRIEEGRLALSSEPVRIGEVLEEAISLIRPQADQRSIAVSNGPEYAGCHILADRQRLKQVFLNLLSNAVKYNVERGSVMISCRVEGEDLMVTIADTGPGIAADSQAVLFQPFERLGAERSMVEGTGLGLTLSLRLVEAMGGTMGLHSAPGRGSAFWVRFPTVRAPIDELEGQELPPGGAEPGAGPERRSTVLYIEDNLSNLKLMERLLALRTGIKLIPAMQGSLGLELAREHHPDLILLDLNLPGVPGHEVLARLRADPTTAGIPVVILSADATKGQIRRLLDAGATAYLTKPFDLEEFLAVLDDALGTNPDTAPRERP